MMSNEISPKVSIIVPVWNPGSSISRCVKSLRSQTLEDIEMIFVDDRNTDGAMDIVRACAAEDPRIRIITNAENVGPGPSRNVGIEASRGAYLSFVDADDYVDIAFLEHLFAKATSNHLDIVKGRLCYVKEDGIKADYSELNDRIREGIQLGKSLFCLFRYEHQTALYRRAFLFDNSIRYGSSRQAEDSTFLLKSCSKVERFNLADSAEYYFCEQSNSLMHHFEPLDLERKLHGFQEQMDYIVDNMADEYYASEYVSKKVHYYLKLCNYLSKKEDCREAANRFTNDFREQVLRFPQLEKLKSESFIASVLCDYGVALAHRPFKLPWADLMVEHYMGTIQEWVDFVKRHPECSNAAEKDLLRLYREAELLCLSDNSHMPPSLVRDVKIICRKNKNNMKQTIRTFIAKIPLVKPFYHAAKRWHKDIRHQCLYAHLRKKQSIIRQGSPECFQNMPLRIDWHLTSYCNFRCSYCFQAGNEYKKVFCTVEQAESAIQHIASANRPGYQVNLIGGEPTTHPHLAEIITLLCKYLGDRLEQLEITTNGSFSESQMETILKAGEQVNMKLYISIHLEYVNVERVVELVKRYSSRTRLQLSLMFHPELIEKTIYMADALCDLRRDFSFKMSPSILREGPQFDRFDSRYTQEHFNCAEKIKKQFEKVSADGPKWPRDAQENFGWLFFVQRNVNDSIVSYERLSDSKLKELTGRVYTGLTCCAGTSIVKIGVDGSVKGMNCAIDRPICNIFEENPFLREDWIHGVVCTKAMCGCSVNQRIPKFRSPTDAQKFIAEKRQEQKRLMSLNK